MSAAPFDPELAQLVAADRADAAATGAAAARRRQAVLALKNARRLCSAAEQCAAAAVLLRSERVADVEAAQALALAAMTGERAARTLAATAFDRLRMLAGAPQKFGTQVVRDGAGARLWPVDAATTDSERSKWDVPPLAVLQRRCAGSDA